MCISAYALRVCISSSCSDIFPCLCVSVWWSVHVSAGGGGGQKCDLEMELKAP